jgi:hypothetical protein
LALKAIGPETPHGLGKDGAVSAVSLPGSILVSSAMTFKKFTNCRPHASHSSGKLMALEKTVGSRPNQVISPPTYKLAKFTNCQCRWASAGM